MSEAQEPGPLSEISESQIDTDSQAKEQPESEKNCCGTSKECKSRAKENEEDNDNASESDWKPEGSGKFLKMDALFIVIRSGESCDKHARARRRSLPTRCHGRS